MLTLAEWCIRRGSSGWALSDSSTSSDESGRLGPAISLKKVFPWNLPVSNAACCRVLSLGKENKKNLFPLSARQQYEE